MSEVDKTPEADSEYFDNYEDDKFARTLLNENHDSSAINSNSSDNNDINANGVNNVYPSSITKTIAQDAQKRNETDTEQVGTKPNPNGFFAETKSEKACSV
jgi:hypothetical protein